MCSGFHVIRFFNFIVTYSELSDVSGWSTDELTNLLPYLISIIFHTCTLIKTHVCTVKAQNPGTGTMLKLAEPSLHKGHTVPLQLLQFPRSG
jgi:hypothetical protein